MSLHLGGRPVSASRPGGLARTVGVPRQTLFAPRVVQHGQAPWATQHNQGSFEETTRTQRSFMCKTTVDGKPMLPTRVEFVRFFQQKQREENNTTAFTSQTKPNPYRYDQTASLYPGRPLLVPLPATTDAAATRRPCRPHKSRPGSATFRQKCVSRILSDSLMQRGTLVGSESPQSSRTTKKCSSSRLFSADEAKITDNRSQGSGAIRKDGPRKGSGASRKGSGTIRKGSRTSRNQSGNQSKNESRNQSRSGSLTSKHRQEERARTPSLTELLENAQLLAEEKKQEAEREQHAKQQEERRLLAEQLAKQKEKEEKLRQAKLLADKQEQERVEAKKRKLEREKAEGEEREQKQKEATARAEAATKIESQYRAKIARKQTQQMVEEREERQRQRERAKQERQASVDKLIVLTNAAVALQRVARGCVGRKRAAEVSAEVERKRKEVEEQKRRQEEARQRAEKEKEEEKQKKAEITKKYGALDSKTASLPGHFRRSLRVKKSLPLDAIPSVKEQE